MRYCAAPGNASQCSVASVAVTFVAGLMLTICDDRLTASGDDCHVVMVLPAALMALTRM